jgi:hypothetical protein
MLLHLHFTFTNCVIILDYNGVKIIYTYKYVSSTLSRITSATNNVVNRVVRVPRIQHTQSTNLGTITCKSIFNFMVFMPLFCDKLIVIYVLPSIITIFII